MNLLESIAVRPILYWVPMYFVFKTVLIIWRELHRIAQQSALFRIPTTLAGLVSPSIAV